MDFANKRLFPNILQQGNEFFPNLEKPTQEEIEPFHRIEVLEIGLEEITVQKEPFFNVTCDND